MEGLKYILKEIEAKRYFLHDFMKAVGTTTKGFVLFRDGVPDCVKDGSLIYRPDFENEPHEHLTLEDFHSLYEPQFRDLRRWSRLSLPLNATEPCPDGYEANEVLAYELGRGYCQGYILVQLWSPSLQQPDRWFHVYVEQRYPEKRYPKNVITPSVLRRQSWKEGARKARPRLSPAATNEECGGDAVWEEDGKAFTAPLIVIDAATKTKAIWHQLLFLALGQGYFGESDRDLLRDELKQYLEPKLRHVPSSKGGVMQSEEIWGDLWRHFATHTFSPYDATSNMSYAKKVVSGYSKQSRDMRGKETEDIKEASYTRNGRRHKDSEGLSPLLLYPSGSVVDTAQQTGVSRWIIYRLIRQGRIRVVRNQHDFLLLDENAVAELKRLADKKEKRSAIYTLAESKGKNKQATKKWLQRHRDLPEVELNKKLGLWLSTREPQAKGEQ